MSISERDKILMQPVYRSHQSLFDSHIEKARAHENDGQNSLALRELREALRLRPRDATARSDIQRLKSIMSPPDFKKDVVPAERLKAVFNLAIRYWDSNMPSAALKECLKCYELLEGLGLPCTCINHNVDAIKDIIRSTRQREQELRSLAAGKKKNNLPVNYDLATLYYDRRMLTVAEAKLVRCRDLAKTIRSMHASKESTYRAASGSRENGDKRRESAELDEVLESSQAGQIKASERIKGIEDDIHHVMKLQTVFSTVTADVPVLPCLLSRFTEHVTECEEWWRIIRSSPLISWHN